MSADEMFEELGYELINDCEFYLLYEKALKENAEYENDFVQITFEKRDKEVVKTYGDDYSAKEISMQELQAINKKCEELGWI